MTTLQAPLFENKDDSCTTTETNNDNKQSVISLSSSESQSSVTAVRMSGLSSSLTSSASPLVLGKKMDSALMPDLLGNHLFDDNLRTSADDDKMHKDEPENFPLLSSRTASTAASILPYPPVSWRDNQRSLSSTGSGGSDGVSPIRGLQKRKRKLQPATTTTASVEQLQNLQERELPTAQDERRRRDPIQDGQNESGDTFNHSSDNVEDIPLGVPIRDGGKSFSTRAEGEKMPLNQHSDDDNGNGANHGGQHDNEDGNNQGSNASERESNADIDDQRRASKIWRARMIVGRTVNHEYVQISVITLIILNAIMMGLATMNWVTDTPHVDSIFNKVDKGFLVIFTLEVSMQLFYLGLALFQDGWLIFDLTIVVMSWSLESLQIVRAFRIFRAFRLITRVKPLRDLVLAIGAVLPRMYAITALLMIIFYVFAVLFTELFSELPLSENYFQTLDASLFTCMQMMTLDWAAIAREVIEYDPWAWAPFTAFIAISGFIVYNLIVAVVVEAVAVTEQTVRALDGLESDSPAAKLERAQERIDLLQCHTEYLVRTQEQVQKMIETMAGELLNLETERMEAEHRETLLRNEMSRKLEYEKSMESALQMESLEKNFAIERERRESRQKLTRRSSSELLDSSSRSVSLDNSRHTVQGDMPPRRGRAQRRGSTKANSSKSVSSVEDAADTKPWKRFLAFQSFDK